MAEESSRELAGPIATVDRLNVAAFRMGER